MFKIVIKRSHIYTTALLFGNFNVKFSFLMYQKGHKYITLFCLLFVPVYK